jgi:hypothetical protein
MDKLSGKSAAESAERVAFAQACIDAAAEWDDDGEQGTCVEEMPPAFLRAPPVPFATRAYSHEVIADLFPYAEYAMW